MEIIRLFLDRLDILKLCLTFLISENNFRFLYASFLSNPEHFDFIYEKFFFINKITY